MRRRSKQEAEAWKELSDSYDSHRKSVQAEMEKRRRALAAAKSKGKERASAEDLDDWDVERRDLPEQFLSSGSVDLARRLVFENAVRTTPLQSRLKELEHTVSRYLALSFRVPHLTSPRTDGSTAYFRQLSITDDPCIRSRPRPSLCASQHLPLRSLPTSPIIHPP